MRAKNFDQYLNEVLGANSMETDPLDLILRPDIIRPNPVTLGAGSSSTIPMHWNNSPFLSGSRLTSAFGINPKAPTRKKALRFHEFIGAVKKLTK
jgi:hypothetical protein